MLQQLNIQKPTPNSENQLFNSISINHRGSYINPEYILLILERANEIIKKPSLKSLLPKMLALMIEVIQGDIGILYLLDKGTNELVIQTIGGNFKDEAQVGTRLKNDVGVVGTAVEQFEPIISADLNQENRWFPKIESKNALQHSRAITFPLSIDGKPIGAVQIFDYAITDFKLLFLLGDQLSAEIYKTINLEKAKRSNRKLQTLIEYMEKTSGNLDRKLLLELVTEQVATLLDAEESSIILMASEDKNNSLRVTTKRDTNSLEDPDDSQAPTIKTEIITEKGPRQPRTLNSHNLGTGFLSNSTVVRPLNSQARPDDQEQATPDNGKITGVLMAHNKQDGFFDDEDAQFLDIIANQASSMLLISKLYDDNNELFIDVITALVAAIDAKDPYTQGHSKRVSDLSVLIGKKFDFSETDLRNLQIGSLLHDVGKIGIPDQILQKPSALTPDEYKLVKQHPAIGKNIMGQVKMLSDALPAIAEHHERLDGSGYPYGLQGKEISLIGRIVAVADVFDALTSDRPYRKAQTYSEALEYLRSRKWAIYDQWCVEALVDIVARKK